MKGVIYVLDYEKIIEVLNDELDKEMKCAKMSDQLMRKTLNPIKRISYLMSRKRFQDHCFGIHLAIRRIEKEIGS